MSPVPGSDNAGWRYFMKSSWRQVHDAILFSKLLLWLSLTQYEVSSVFQSGLTSKAYRFYWYICLAGLHSRSRLIDFLVSHSGGSLSQPPCLRSWWNWLVLIRQFASRLTTDIYTLCFWAFGTLYVVGFLVFTRFARRQAPEPRFCYRPPSHEDSGLLFSPFAESIALRPSGVAILSPRWV